MTLRSGYTADLEKYNAIYGSSFSTLAQGKHLGGLLRMQYEGHGIHVSAVKRSGGAAVAPTPVASIPEEVSCANHCGEQAPGGCACDTVCTDRGDCCSDHAAVCTAN